MDLESTSTIDNVDHAAVAEEAGRAAGQRRDWTAGLRAVADFVDAHPDFDLPDTYGVRFYVWVRGDTDDEVKAELARLAGLIGMCDKKASGDYFELVRGFGPHELSVVAAREQVCTQVVVGVETVEVETVAADAVDEAASLQARLAALPKTTVVEERQITEWRCPESILAAAKDRF